MKDLGIAILGGGNMGRALIGGLVRRGAAAASIAVGEASAQQRDALARELGVGVFADNAAALGRADVVILAVKPQDVAATLVPLAEALRARRPILLSVAAGVRISALRHAAGETVPIVRAMPNRPALVGAGVTGLFTPGDVRPHVKRTAEEVMRAVGEVVWVRSEDELDVVTALSGSGPAYYFLLTELMIQSAVDLGLEPDAARTLALHTLQGAGQLAGASDGDLARLRAAVTSKGGTTEAALRAYEDAGLRDIVARALAAATRRARELAAQFEKPEPPRTTK
jgi:pyrroline-5-carboxylate reductase